MRLREPATDLFWEIEVVAEVRVVVPEPKISLERSPERLKEELLVTEPDNLSREELRVPEEIKMLLATEAEPIDTSPEPARISVVPEPEMLELRVPPVSWMEPEDILIPLEIPSALELKVPEVKLIA